MTISHARILAGAAIAALVLGTFSTATATATAAESDKSAPTVLARGPGFHQPAVGSCHVLKLRHFYGYSAPTRAVPCSQRHTSKTLVVKRLKGKVDWKRPDLLRPIWFTCMRKAQRVLGGNDKARAMSAYSPSFFIPNKRERARGAKWLRCDLALLGGRMLQPLPTELKLGSLPLKEAVARCLSGTERALRTTVCAKRHTYRATGAFKPAGKTYPGQEGLAKAAHRRCPKLTTSRRWRYQVPVTADMWKAGYRTVVCYSKTRK